MKEHGLELVVSPWVEEKIFEFHAVSIAEVEEAFSLHNGFYLEDQRAAHRSNPPTWWFVGETALGRLLKVVFIWDKESDYVILRTAFEPSDEEIDIYEAHT